MGSISCPQSFLKAMQAPSIDGNVFKPSSPKDALLTNVAKSLILNNAETNDDPFYMLDLSVVATLMDRWAHSLAGVVPFYAVKCNTDANLLAALAEMGCNFDCASKAEIEAVLSLGVTADRIIFANPSKLESHIKYAASVGVNLTTFDTEAELEKIRKVHPKCNLLLRIKSPEESGGVRELGTKYGAVPDEVTPLLEAARVANLSVIGVSFHVGSAATNTHAYVAAIKAARSTFDIAVSIGMPQMTVLDIGGGFFAGGEVFEEAASGIKGAVKEHFNGVKLTIIAEPGRFFAETAFGLAVRIVGKRVRAGERQYWLNDGLYGSFIGIVVLGVRSYGITCMPVALHANPNKTMSLKEYKSTLFGPTCDSHDMVLNNYRLPELEVDDWLVFPDMGAYTSVFRSNFNGFNTSPFLTYLVATHQEEV